MHPRIILRDKYEGKDQAKRRTVAKGYTLLTLFPSLFGWDLFAKLFDPLFKHDCCQIRCKILLPGYDCYLFFCDWKLVVALMFGPCLLQYVEAFIPASQIGVKKVHAVNWAGVCLLLDTEQHTELIGSVCVCVFFTY